jgi:hypothetical protein
MDVLHEFMQKWGDYLHEDPVLAKRNSHVKCSLKEGKAIVEVDIEDKGVFSVILKGGKFNVSSGKAATPLLSWKIPTRLFKDVLLGKERILYAMLDESCKLSFDTPNFTHWDGATAVEVMVRAQEMVKESPEIRKMVEEL